MEVYNTTRGVVLVQDVEVAFDFWKRFKGLLGRRSFPVGAGLLLKPCNSVHSCFMAFPFDVLFLNEEMVKRSVTLLSSGFPILCHKGSWRSSRSLGLVCLFLFSCARRPAIRMRSWKTSR